jgi:hypothetical protein
MGKSAFERQKTVESGLVQNCCLSVSLSVSDGRVWIGSAVKSFSVVVGRVSVVAFERGSRLERIFDSAFRDTGIQSIVIPSSVVDLGKKSFCGCKSLESVIFESGSRLERIEESAFEESGLHSIDIPSSVVVLGKKSFYWCKSLKSAIFESGSRLEQIDESALENSGLQSIRIPSSVILLGKRSLYRCKVLESVIFESDSPLERIEINRDFIVCCSFAQREFLCVIFENGSRLERIEASTFHRSELY